MRLMLAQRGTLYAATQLITEQSGGGGLQNIWTRWKRLGVLDLEVSLLKPPQSPLKTRVRNNIDFLDIKRSLIFRCPRFSLHWTSNPN